MSSAVKKQLQLKGPRPPPLIVKKTTANIIKKSTFVRDRRDRRSPVVIYLRSPKIIHVQPEEFKSFVQRLTGNQTHVAAVVSSSSASGSTRPGAEFAAACRRSTGDMPVESAADPSSFEQFIFS